MPSDVMVPVALVDKVREHPNADRLDIVEVLGWQCVVQKGTYSQGDVVVYFPPDTLIPQDCAEQFGVLQYLGGKEHDRVRQIRLRGEPSFGLVVPSERSIGEVGFNVAEDYGATKYEPPIRPGCGDAETDHPFFTAYGRVENMRNYPQVLENEVVVVSEKLHGTNARAGIIDGEKMAGSHQVRRKEPEDYERSLYWFPFSLGPVDSMLDALGWDHQQVILYGEVYGGSVQSLSYGIPKGKGLGFRAFDLLIDGQFLDYMGFAKKCAAYGVDTVPVFGVVPFSLELIREMSEGPSVVPGADHIREGVVVKTVEEKMCPQIGRMILKYLSDEYLLGKHSDFVDR